MPLYDFICKACSAKATLLLKSGEIAVCPTCQSQEMSKQFSAFAIHGARKEQLSRQQDAQKPSGHVHTAACQGGCGAGAKAQDLIKKYLD